jgi:hypothetical protein
MEEPVAIPPELLAPTVEELERRTQEDKTKPWRVRKRPGKKERHAKKHEAERAKFQQLAQEYDTGKTEAGAPQQASPAPARVLRGSFGAVKGSASVTAKATIFDPNAPKSAPPRRRGRPPKFGPLF